MWIVCAASDADSRPAFAGRSTTRLCCHSFWRYVNCSGVRRIEDQSILDSWPDLRGDACRRFHVDPSYMRETPLTGLSIFRFETAITNAVLVDGLGCLPKPVPAREESECRRILRKHQSGNAHIGVAGWSDGPESCPQLGRNVWVANPARKPLAAHDPVRFKRRLWPRLAVL